VEKENAELINYIHAAAKASGNPWIESVVGTYLTKGESESQYGSTGPGFLITVKLFGAEICFKCSKQNLQKWQNKGPSIPFFKSVNVFTGVFQNLCNMGATKIVLNQKPRNMGHAWVKESAFEIYSDGILDLSQMPVCHGVPLTEHEMTVYHHCGNTMHEEHASTDKVFNFANRKSLTCSQCDDAVRFQKCQEIIGENFELLTKSDIPLAMHDSVGSPGQVNSSQVVRCKTCKQVDVRPYDGRRMSCLNCRGKADQTWQIYAALNELKTPNGPLQRVKIGIAIDTKARLHKQMNGVGKTLAFKSFPAKYSVISATEVMAKNLLRDGSFAGGLFESEDAFTRLGVLRKGRLCKKLDGRTEYTTGETLEDLDLIFQEVGRIHASLHPSFLQEQALQEIAERNLEDAVGRAADKPSQEDVMQVLDQAEDDPAEASVACPSSPKSATKQAPDLDSRAA
jgi:hypothetical protein